MGKSNTFILRCFFVIALLGIFLLPKQGLIYAVSRNQTNQEIINEDEDIKRTEKGTEETLKTQIRTTVRLIQGRSQSLLAPRLSQVGPYGTSSYGDAGSPAKVVQTGNSNASHADAGQGVMSTPPLAQTGATGLAAGDEAAQNLGFGIWYSSGLGFLGSYKSGNKYDGVTTVNMLGMDYMLSPRTVVGLGFGIETSFLDTEFSRSGSISSSGYTFAPYISIALFEDLIFDMVGGISFLSNGSTYSAYNDSWRLMVSPNITYFHVIDNLLLSGSFGYTYAREDSYSYKNSYGFKLFDLPDYKMETLPDGRPDAIQTGEIRVAGRASYSFDMLAPYLGAAYIFDTMEDELDPDEVEVSLGLDFYPTESIILSLETAGSFFRNDYYNYRGAFNMRYEF